jgi:hypothetical protein
MLAVPSAPGPAFLNKGVDAASFQQLRLASLSLTGRAAAGKAPLRLTALGRDLRQTPGVHVVRWRCLCPWAHSLLQNM